MTTLDNLRKAAKRWLKDVRAGDADARARLRKIYANAPEAPTLRHVQHALALERGFDSWRELMAQASTTAESGPQPALEHDQLIARFLEYACPDHHIRGLPEHAIARHAAIRLLQQHPEIARDSFYTAVVCGDLEHVERLLQERPELATTKSSETSADRAGVGERSDLFRDIGPKGWEPLLYLSFARLPLAAVDDNAVAIARALLVRGANPNAYFMAGNSRYTPLVGVVGEGEENRPPHPQRDALARLLLEYGAEPYDTQVVYNIHFHGHVLWFLELMHEFSEMRGRQRDWDDPEWHMLDMGGYGSGARWHLGIAVGHNDLELAEWCLTHGATPNAAPPRAKSLSQQTLHEDAVRAGRLDLADLLARHGAHRTPAQVDEEDAFVAACVNMDRREVARLLERHPEYLASPKAIFAAASRDRADVVAFLLDIGVPIEVEDQQHQRTLHRAAMNDAVAVASLLIDRGAAIDPVEGNWQATPIGIAIYNEYPRMIELLGRYSRQIGSLTFTGKLQRLREVLAISPDLAQDSSALFWLPDDEATAIDMAALLIAAGADPHARSDDGATAAEVARRRGMYRVAEVLDGQREV